MGASWKSCCCWCKRNSAKDTPVTVNDSTPSLRRIETPSINPINPSTDSPNVIYSPSSSSTTPPADPSVTVNPSTPSPQDIQTSPINPSTDSPNHPQNEISPTSSSSTTAPPPSTSKKSPPTLEEVKRDFQKINITSQENDLIAAIEEVLNTAQKHTQDTPTTSSPHTDKLAKWDFFFKSGGKFLKFFNDHTEKMKINTEDSSFQSGEAAKLAGSLLKNIGDLHWAVAGISILGYMVSKCAKVSDNRTECLELLQEMIKLVSRIKELNILVQEEKKFEEALEVIIEGSISCASQLDSGKFFRFMKSTVNSEKLSAIRSKISGLYRDLNLTATTSVLSRVTGVHGEISKQTATIKEIAEETPVRKEILPEDYPSNAVGIDDQLKAVNKLLDMENMEDCSSIAVVIWGLGGIGKTTLAQAVVHTVDRNRYNYARIELDLVSDKNNYKEMQQQILKDAFPGYEGGRKIDLRDDKDGRAHLTQAFKSQAHKPVFLFIDNALDKKDLGKILPEDLRGLPQRSRILVTTRILKETDMLQEGGLRCKDYPVETLSDDPALTILCNDLATCDGIKDDLERIVKLCGGIPLVLKIVGAHLRRQKYKADRCTQIVGALQTGGKIKEEDLSNRLFDFVYSKLEESTQEAFLDICRFFHEHLPRRLVEHIVGAEEVESLVDAALITTMMKKDEEGVVLPAYKVLSTQNVLSAYRVLSAHEVLSAHDIIRSIGLSKSKSSRIMDENSWIEAEKDEAKLKGIKGVLLEKEDYVLEKRHLHSMKDTLRILIWSGRIDVRATDAVTLPELRFIMTGDICGLNVEALAKLAVLVCEKLPTKPRDHLKLPESLRLIIATIKPVETQVLSKTVPNSSLEGLFITFSRERDTSKNAFNRDEEEDESKNAFNRFLQGLNKLKYLEVKSCHSLCELPEQVCWLPQLSTLDMYDCTELKCLPELFGQLINLRKLTLRLCSSLKQLPSTFDQLTNLQELDLNNCRSLKELPSTFGKLTNLQELELFNCRSLKELPSTFDELTNLQKLDLGSCISLEELPSTFSQLTNLQELDLRYCESLEELPFTFGQLTNLQELDLTLCESLKKLPSTFDQLTNLRKLRLDGCKSLEELPSTFGQLTNLRELNLTDCESLKELPSTFNNLKSLEYLHKNGCYNLESDICQMNDNIKIVKKTEHHCFNCQEDKKLYIYWT